MDKKAFTPSNMNDFEAKSDIGKNFVTKKLVRWTILIF